MTTRRGFLRGVVGLTTAGTVVSGFGVDSVRAAGSDWPTFQGDTERSGFTAAVESPVTDVEIEWQQDVGQPIYAQPVRTGDQIVVSAIGRNDDTGQLVGLDTDGTERWSRSVSISALSTPFIRDGTVFQTGPETVVARSLASGDIDWSVGSPTSVFCSPLVVGNTVVVGTRLGTLQALSTTDGSNRWTTTLSGVVSATPAATDDLIVAGTDEGTVAALNLTSGDVRWRRELGSAVRCPVTIGNDIALVATAAGRLHALELDGGDQQWATDGSRPTVSAPVYTGDTCYWSGGSQISAIDVSDGTERWRTDTGGYTGLSSVSPSPVATRETVYVTTGGATVYALDRSDGTERWTFSPPSGGDVLSLAAGDGQLYVGTADGVLYALGGRTNYRPEPAFTYAPRNPSPGDEITFDATDAKDPDGSIETFRWDFDNDGEFEATGQRVTRILDAGEHPVRLAVVDNEGARTVSSDGTTVSVTTAPTTTDDSSTGDGLAAYVDHLPGDELGAVGGATGLLGGLGLYRLASGRGSDQPDQTAPETDNGQTSETPPAEDESDETRVHPVDTTEATFDAFDIGESLGSGPMTEVNAGTHAPTGSSVAIEGLAGSAGYTVDRGLFERFAGGIDVWSRIDDHPNVVSVVANGTEPSPWAALERCTTQLTPSAMADRSFEEIKSHLVGVLEGVHHGHRHGLYHGALTPDNVMLLAAERTDSDGTVAVVSDWEVTAAQLDPSLDIAEVYPRYAAPEQITPQFREPDPLTDIYQVGVLAYALTTGTHPFEKPPDADEHSVETVVPPSERASGVPEGLNEVVSTALAADPDDRYQTALHFRDALERL